MLKQIVTATVEEIRKRERPRRRWGNNFEQDLNITRTEKKKKEKMATDGREGAGVHT